MTENEEIIAKKATVEVAPKDVEIRDDKDKTIKTLKKELKLIQDEKQKLEILYRGAEGVIKKLEEEKDRLLIQVKDMNEYVETSEEVKDKEVVKQVCKFRWKGGDMEGMKEACKICDYKAANLTNMTNHMAWKHRNISQVEQEVVRPKEKAMDLLKCTVYKCEQQFDTKENMNKHVKSEHLKQFNCDNCYFQATNVLILNKHINLKHKG